MLVLPFHLPTSRKNYYFSFFLPNVAGEKVEIGVGGGSKTTLSGQKILPHMVQKLYCERYLSIQSMLERKGEKKTFQKFWITNIC